MSLPTLLKPNKLIPHMGETFDDKTPAITYIINWINSRITTARRLDDRIIILKAATGSGKSTVLCSELYLRLKQKLKKTILVTQPRVLTTISIPNDIHNIYKNKGIKLHENIGYQTKEYTHKPVNRGILFVSVGILLQYLKNIEHKDFINKFSVIIIDEVQIQTTNLDLIFYYMKQLFQENKIDNMPFLILMSATLDVNKYKKYFSTNTVFEVTGTSFKITDEYLKYSSANVFSTIKEKLINIIKTDEDTTNDIIIFVPGVSFMNKVYDIVESMDELFPVLLDSTRYKLSDKDYQNLFNRTKKRKVIISTNIAEIGVTIDSLKYCIDTGLYVSAEFNPFYNSKMLITKVITNSMMMQRRGRVGRKSEGYFFPLYTEETSNKLLNMQFPDIYLDDITQMILSVLILKYQGDKFSKFKINIDDVIDPPSKIAVNNSLNKLYIYGMVYANGCPTRLGILANKTRNITIENIKMIITGYYYNCNILDLITIAAFNQCSKSKLFMNNFKALNFPLDEDYDINRLKNKIFIGCEFIDFLIFFNNLKNENIKNAKEVCEHNKINYTEFLNVIKIREEMIQELMFNMNLNPFKNKSNLVLKLNNQYTFNEAVEEIKKIKQCMYEGYRLNLAIYDKHDYRIYKTNKILNTSSYLVKNLPYYSQGDNFKTDKPEYILYDELLIKKNPISKLYEYSTNSVCILSGFINIDLFFEKN